MHNSNLFVRTGPLMDITSYPEWAQEMVAYCDPYKSQVVQHELFHRMREGEIAVAQHRAFLSGTWPVIDQFPQYMARNLIKIHYGQGLGHEKARRYLVRNIRVEQSHADRWVDWAQASGVNIQSMLSNSDAVETLCLSQWCCQVCDRESLAIGMAATNYAIEGATGEWTALVCSKDTYEKMFDTEIRAKAMKWLKLHAKYDDEHPWEALEIIVTLVGLNPDPKTVVEIQSAICRSHKFMRMLLDFYLRSVNSTKITANWYDYA